MSERVSKQLRTSDVIKFWVPLSATWLMMAAEGPILTSVIARLPDPTYNLAAYGVAIALAMLIESPVIMLLSTSVALAVDRNAFMRLREFMWRINAMVTVGMLVVSIPFVYNIVTLDVIHLPLPVADSMYWAVVCLIPWPAAIGFRRFYQGLLIRSGLTRRVAYGTVVRLSGMAGTAFMLVVLSPLAGTVIGAVSLSVGVIAEAIATRRMARGVVRAYRNEDEAKCAPAPTYPEILRFYSPLAMTSIVGFMVTPMLAFFLGRAPMSVESLAVLPVVDSFVFLFRSFGFSFQEVGIALIGPDRRNLAVLKRVGFGIMACTTVIMIVVAFTPVASIVFQGMYGLTERMADFAIIPTMILVPLPALAVLYSLQRAIVINARKNVVVAWSTIAEVGLIAVVMVVMIATVNPMGAISAAVAMIVGRLVANVYLSSRTARILKAP